jgi:hypothetical protein
MKYFVSLLQLMIFLFIFGLPPSSIASPVIIDNRTWSTNVDCGGDCFGATYSLVVTDANDANLNTYSATMTVAIGTYTGSMTYIGAVDFKPGNVIAPVVLTEVSGPAGTMAGGNGAWTTQFQNGQAAGNCLNGAGGFLCSYDTGANGEAPIANNRTYSWSWDFTLNGAYSFGHFGVNYTVADDSGNCGQQVTGPDCLQDGQNLSISSGGYSSGAGTGGQGGDSPRVPEPSAFFLLGCGLLLVSKVLRKCSKSPVI